MVVYVILKDYLYRYSAMPELDTDYTEAFIGLVKDLDTARNIIEIFIDQLLDDSAVLNADKVCVETPIKDDTNIAYTLNIETLHPDKWSDYIEHEYVCYKTKRIEL